MRWLLLLLLLGLPVGCFAAEARLEPARVPQGGISILRFAGAPPRSAVARFRSTPLFLHPDAEGAMRLLGVDLAAPPGLYPISLLVEFEDGRVERFALTLEVEERDVEVESLSLPQAMVSPQDPAVLERIRSEAGVLADLFARAGPPLFAAPARLPVDDPVGSTFGTRRILNGEPRSPHAGVDFRSPHGRTVRAPLAGLVVAVADYYYTGRTVVLDHGGGLLSLYAHLDSAAVVEGARVAGGDALGRVGSSGRSTGPHLHWSVRLNRAKVDPLALLEVFNREKP